MNLYEISSIIKNGSKNKVSTMIVYFFTILPEARVRFSNRLNFALFYNNKCIIFLLPDMFLTMWQYIDMYLRHTELLISRLGYILNDVPSANFWLKESARPAGLQYYKYKCKGNAVICLAILEYEVSLSIFWAPLNNSTIKIIVLIKTPNDFFLILGHCELS